MPLRLPRILTSLTKTLLPSGASAGRLPDGRAAIAFAPNRHISLEDTASDEPKVFTAIGFRQTAEPACRGGKPNANFFRFRHKRMRAIARTFRGQPFITGHDWGDARARGGTLIDAWAEPPPDALDELAFYAKVKATADWAIRGLGDGTIDRFSIGALGIGEITCTVHGTPVWTECWCWPGYLAEAGLVEWEYEDAKGVEWSAVNVPAVDGTMILDEDELEALSDDVPLEAELEQLRLVCGRAWDPGAIAALVATVGGAPKGGFPRTVPAITMSPCPTAPAQGSNQMDRALLCKTLGLPATATDEEILAHIAQQGTNAAQAPVLQAQLAELAADRDRVAASAHVESEITRLRASRQVGDQVVTTLRATASGPGGRAAFDTSLKLVEASAPPALVAGAAPHQRVALQSDARPALAPGAVDAGEEPDAYEQNKGNPHLSRFMKRCGLTAEQVRKHGTATVNVVPELAKLVDATARRGG